MSGFRALVCHTQPEALGELVEILASPQLSVETARSATEAMHRVASGDYAVIVSDHKPPELDGIDLLERTIAFAPDALRIVISNDIDALARVEQRPAGTVFRFVGKPWERRQLVGIVTEGLKLHRLEQEQRELIRKLGVEYAKLQRREKLLDVVVRERTKELEDSYENLKIANRQALLGLAEAIDAKDSYTKGHCGRVAAYAMALAEVCGYPEDGMEALEFAAFLHDIGKIGVRDAVLLKPGPLDEAEWVHMRTHPIKGYEIASQIAMLKPAMAAIRNHHERWDGTGYPDGLVAENIPMSARIVAIADAYDAMATDRPYKQALPVAECDRLLRKNSGVMYDPALVELFVSNRLGELLRGAEEQETGVWDVNSSSQPVAAAAPPGETRSEPAAAPSESRSAPASPAAALDAAPPGAVDAPAILGALRK